MSGADQGTVGTHTEARDRVSCYFLFSSSRALPPLKAEGGLGILGVLTAHTSVRCFAFYVFGDKYSSRLPLAAGVAEASFFYFLRLCDACLPLPPLAGDMALALGV